MVDLNTQYEEMEANYKEIFIEAAEMIRSAIDKFKPDVSCKSCRKTCSGMEGTGGAPERRRCTVS